MVFTRTFADPDGSRRSGESGPELRNTAPGNAVSGVRSSPGKAESPGRAVSSAASPDAGLQARTEGREKTNPVELAFNGVSSAQDRNRTCTPCGTRT